MEQDKEQTTVVFRKFIIGCAIIAIFPKEKANPRHYLSYMRLGQHGECCHDIVSITKPTRDDGEYKALKEELESIGYNLLIRKRITR